MTVLVLFYILSFKCSVVKAEFHLFYLIFIRSVSYIIYNLTSIFNGTTKIPEKEMREVASSNKVTIILKYDFQYLRHLLNFYLSIFNLFRKRRIV